MFRYLCLDSAPSLVRLFHHAFPFWVYAVFCAVTVLFTLFFVPETKGRSLEEIERMWMERMDPHDTP